MNTNADLVKQLTDVRGNVVNALSEVEKGAEKARNANSPSDQLYRFQQIGHGVELAREALGTLSKQIKSLKAADPQPEVEDEDTKQDRLRAEIANAGEPLGYGFVIETILNSLDSEQLEFLLEVVQEAAADKVDEQAMISPEDQQLAPIRNQVGNIAEVAQVNLDGIVADLDYIPRVGQWLPEGRQRHNLICIRKAQKLIEFAKDALELLR